VLKDHEQIARSFVDTLLRPCALDGFRILDQVGGHFTTQPLREISYGIAVEPMVKAGIIHSLFRLYGRREPGLRCDQKAYGLEEG
jgi:hypothetical protein